MELRVKQIVFKTPVVVGKVSPLSSAVQQLDASESLELIEYRSGVYAREAGAVVGELFPWSGIEKCSVEEIEPKQKKAG